MEPEEKEPVDDLIDEIPDDEAPPDQTSEDEEEAPPSEPKIVAKTPKEPVKPPVVVPPVVRQPPPKRDVPLATFLEEKNKFTKALDEQRARADKLEQELAALKNPPKAAPKHADDPEGYIAHATRAAAADVLKKLDETANDIKEVKTANATQTEQRQQQEAHNRFLEEVGALEEEFVTTTPDYAEALMHVRKIAFDQIKEFHPDATDQQIMAEIGKQELQLASNALKNGRNPHEVAYRMAVINGYKKAEQPPVVPPKAGIKKVVPKIPKEEALDPDVTLGKSAGGDEGGDEDDDAKDPNTYDAFDDAIKEMFGGRKRA